MKIKTKHSQKTIAKTIKCSQATVSFWLNLIKRPTGLYAEALQREFPDLYKAIEEKWNAS